MLEEDGNIKLIDFGLSIDLSDKEVNFSTAGTPGFLAPEVVHGAKNAPIDYSVDTYALGITFYCMVAGLHPFDGHDYREIVNNNSKGVIDFDNRDLRSELQYGEL